MKKQLPGWAVLLIITLVAGLALGGTYALTKDPIAQQALLQAEAARKAALPEADTFEALTLGEGASVDWANAGLKTVRGKSVPLTLEDIDAIAGATITSTAVVNAINAAYEQYKAAPSDAAFTGEAQGFASPVAVEATFDGDTIATLKIGDGRFAETAGLGARAQEPAFIDQFVAGEKVVGYVAQTTVKGYKGPVEVTVGLDTNLTLTGISVGGSDFAETAGLGAKAKEPEFQSQFAGKKTPISVIKKGGTPGDNTVDAITAATITSNAVRDAVNGVAKYVKKDILGVADIEMPARPADESTIFSAKERGFASDVYVEAAFDADGKITYIGIGDGDFGETAGYGAAALEAENQYPFIGAQMPLELGDVDTLTGATYTKTAIVNGLNKAYDASRGVEAPVAEEPVQEEPVVEEPAKEEPVQEEPAKEEPVQEEPAKDTENAVTAEVQGFGGPVAVKVTFDGDTITSLTVGDERFAETPGLGGRAQEEAFQAQFVGKKVPLALADIDVIAGATITSTAVVEAVNAAYAAAQPAAEKPAKEEPAAEEPVQEEPAQEEAAEPEKTYAAEINAGNGILQVRIAVEEGRLTFLKASQQEQELKEKFLNAALPLSVQQDGTVAFSAAVAINKAYEQYLAEHPEAVPAARDTAAENAAFTGEAVTFFTAVKAEAVFEGDTLAALTLKKSTVGTDGEEAMADAYQQALLGKKMPLSGVTVENVPAYEAAAVTIAVNEAYAKSLAGQQ